MLRSISMLARHAIKSNPGDLSAAKAALKAQLCSDSALLNKVLDEIITVAVNEVIGWDHRVRNGRLFRKATDHTATIRAVLFDMALRDGTKLCDARKANLRVEIVFFYEQGSTMLRKGRFYKTILNRLPDETTPVAAVLTEADLQVILDGASQPLRKAMSA